MAFNLSCEKFLESFACAHINEGLFENDGWDMISCFMQSDGTPSQKIATLKERGNNLFNQKCYGADAACYDEACKLLNLVVGMKDSYDTKSLSDLVISLNLNLVSCALKLVEYEAAKDLCSIVLSSFPHNVKALFRRGVAFMKLKKFSDALLDFEEALLVEPKNKDILRELCVVKNCLTINSNGKRSLDDHSVTDPSGKGKMHIHDEGRLGNSLIESGGCSEKDSCFGSSSVQDNNISYSSSSITQSLVTEKCDKKLHTSNFVLDQVDKLSCITSASSSIYEASCNFGGANVISLDNFGSYMDLNLDLEDYHGVEKSMFNFRKKGGHSRLKIDARTYKKLLDEKEKRRKRRKSLRDVYVTRDTASDSMSFSSVDSIKHIDCDPPVEDATSSLPNELVSHHALCDSTEANSHHLPPFIFTSTKANKAAKDSSARSQSIRIQSRRAESPRRNVYINPGKLPRSSDVSVSYCRYPLNHQVKGKKKRRIITRMKDYSKRDESPRHNLSTCSSSRPSSHKFLRLHGVSVPCCRYSSEAQLIKEKKRKDIFAHLSISDRPLKKPTLLVIPNP